MADPPHAIERERHDQADGADCQPRDRGEDVQPQLGPAVRVLVQHQAQGGRRDDDARQRREADGADEHAGRARPRESIGPDHEAAREDGDDDQLGESAPRVLGVGEARRRKRVEPAEQVRRLESDEHEEDAFTTTRTVTTSVEPMRQPARGASVTAAGASDATSPNAPAATQARAAARANRHPASPRSTWMPNTFPTSWAKTASAAENSAMKTIATGTAMSNPRRTDAAGAACRAAADSDGSRRCALDPTTIATARDPGAEAEAEPRQRPEVPRHDGSAAERGERRGRERQRRQQVECDDRRIRADGREGGEREGGRREPGIPSVNAGSGASEEPAAGKHEADGDREVDAEPDPEEEHLADDAERAGREEHTAGALDQWQRLPASRCRSRLKSGVRGQCSMSMTMRGSSSSVSTRTHDSPARPKYHVLWASKSPPSTRSTSAGWPGSKSVGPS